MLDEHYGMVMTFNALSKKLYSLKQGMGENVAEFGMCLSQQVQILQMEYPAEFNKNMRKRCSGTASMKALTLSINKHWPTKLMGKILSPILNCS